MHSSKFAVRSILIAFMLMLIVGMETGTAKAATAESISAGGQSHVCSGYWWLLNGALSPFRVLIRG